MGKVIATCGHEIKNYPKDSIDIVINDHDRECEPCLCYMSVCRACVGIYWEVINWKETATK